MWNGDYRFLLTNLVLKDFRIRYRNMSLGAFWSLLNPLVMMGVLSFVFSNVFKNTTIPHFPLYILSGIIPFNFFALAWITGTTSLADNSGLIKRVPVPREIVPIASVLSNCLHLVIQIALLLTFALFSGPGVTVQWLWLPLIWGVEIVFICGMSLITSGVNVYLRDTRYIVESVNTILFWFVPIFYTVAFVPAQYKGIFLLNPITAVVIALRAILLDGQAPPAGLMINFVGVSFGALAAGLLIFRKLKNGFYDYL
jgi:ABC-type polysaccharide/polyol phosphate export permease